MASEARDKPYIGEILDRVLELEKLDKEGATLKNVSDNMRTLMVCAAMLVAVSAAVRATAGWWPLQSCAVLWGAWTLVYGLLACFQSSLLFMAALQDYVLHKRLKKGGRSAITALAFLSMAFCYGAILLVALTAFNVMGKR